MLLSLMEGFERAGKKLVLTRCRHHRGLIEALLSRRDSESLDVADDPIDALERCEEALLGVLSQHAVVEREVPLTEQRLLHGLTPVELRLLEPHLRRISYHAGEVILREGDPSPDLYFIVQGRVSVVLGAPEKPAVVIAEIPAGFCFGEMAMVGRRPRSASIRADVKTACLSLPFELLDRPELNTIQHKLLRNLALDLSERLRRVTLG